MAKRFTDTEKWHDPWYRKLTAEGKALWQLLTDLCDNVGFWKKDYELASFLCNFDVTDQTLRDINRDKERVRDHGKFLEVVDFIQFQFGELKDTNNFHVSIIGLREKYRNQGLIRGSGAPMEKDKEREKVKKSSYSTEFDDFWQLYPKRVGKPNAFAQWQKLSDEDHAAILADIPQRLEDDKWVNGFVKDPERYLKHRQWEDEITAQKGSGTEIKRY